MASDHDDGCRKCSAKYQKLNQLLKQFVVLKCCNQSLAYSFTTFLLWNFHQNENINNFDIRHLNWIWARLNLKNNNIRILLKIWNEFLCLAKCLIEVNNLNWLKNRRYLFGICFANNFDVDSVMTLTCHFYFDSCAINGNFQLANTIFVWNRMKILCQKTFRTVRWKFVCHCWMAWAKSRLVIKTLSSNPLVHCLWHFCHDFYTHTPSRNVAIFLTFKIK